MKNYRVNSISKQRGMTLIELTVVLLILIGLAGLLLPYVGGFNEKTQNSSAADSLAEVSKAIHRFDAQFMAMPDGFDTLYNGTGLITDWMPNPVAAAEVLTTCPLTEAQVNNLIGSEIDSLFPMKAGEPDDDNFNATFDGTVVLPSTDANYGTNGATNIATGTVVACLDHADVENLLVKRMGVEVETEDFVAGTAKNDYLVVGVGQKSQMSSKTISEAPVYFNSANPTSHYNRFLAIFRVSKTGPTTATPLVAVNRVQFIGALSPDIKTQADFQQAHFASAEDAD